jgi:hypothetical protein
MFSMDSKDWTILLIGTVLGFIPALAAVLLTNPMLKFLERRKLVSQSKRFTKAARFHDLIVKLHTGKIDKYLYAIALVGLTITLVAIPTWLLLLILVAPSGLERDILTFILVVVGFLSCLTAMWLLFYLHKVISALDRFDEFDAEFKKQWVVRPAT